MPFKKGALQTHEGLRRVLEHEGLSDSRGLWRAGQDRWADPPCDVSALPLLGGAASASSGKDDRDSRVRDDRGFSGKDNRRHSGGTGKDDSESQLERLMGLQARGSTASTKPNCGRTHDQMHRA